MTTTLVGPLPTVRFYGGPGGHQQHSEVVVTRPLPANTMDLRFAACTVHRTACDCREAIHAEDLAELRSELTAVRTALTEAVGRHAVRVYDEQGEHSALLSCHCPVCQLVRDHHLEHLIDSGATWIYAAVRP